MVLAVVAVAVEVFVHVVGVASIDIPLPHVFAGRKGQMLVSESQTTLEGKSRSLGRGKTTRGGVWVICPRAAPGGSVVRMSVSNVCKL